MSDDSIKKFISENTNNFTLDLDRLIKKDIFNKCGEIIVNSDNYQSDSLAETLQCLRILSRDITMRESFCDKTILDRLFTISGLKLYSSMNEDCIELLDLSSFIVVEESIKVLCNVTKNFHSDIPIELFATGVLGILHRMQLYDIASACIPATLKIFEMKLLFLLTALEKTSRAVAIDKGHCLVRFNSLFKSQLKVGETISIDDLSLDTDIVKCIFNIFLHIDDNEMDPDLERDVTELLTSIRDLVLCVAALKTIPDLLRTDFISDSANLLTTIPSCCYQVFICREISVPDNEWYMSDEAMKFFNILLDLAMLRLQENKNLNDTISPLMHGLAKASQSDRNIRKYCRLKVLPYLKDEVMQLPEQGTSLRNKLCKLLQHPVENVTESVAFFLFIICKESVDRAIKYTGFGNFAGFLARHALLAQKRDDESSSPDYSDSEDSETEEYSKVKDKVNPVTGRVEENKTNPLDGMTDEQKEFEVVQLMNQIDRLQREGFIQPGMISEDGKVRAAESILELIEKSAAQKAFMENNCCSGDKVNDVDNID